MNCIIVVASGDVSQGELALNLGLSIKANDKNVTTALIYTHAALHKSKEPLIRRLFDFAIKADESNGEYLKLNAYNIAEKHISNLDKGIVLDCSVLILPGKKPSKWFDDLHSYEFTMWNNDEYDMFTGIRKRNDYTFYCEPQEARIKYNIDNTAKMPQVKSNFIYFYKGAYAKKMFDTAIEVFNNNKSESPKAELCFNVAFALTNKLPHRTFFYPVFPATLSQQRNEEYIYHHYIAIELDKDAPEIVSLYKRCSDYYRKINGITEPFDTQQNFKPEYKGERDVYGFWHICMINEYKNIVVEQFKLLNNSGLYEKSKNIYVGCVGSHEQLKWLQTFFKSHRKVKILTHKEDLKSYEFPTLKLYKFKADTEKPFYGWYIHTKGVTYPNHPGGKYWRDYMNYFNITKWDICQQKLRNGYDTCGATWIPEGSFPRHYSGNFYHFDSNYIKKLPPVSSYNQSDRFLAEFYIGRANPVAATLCQKRIDYNHTHQFTPEECHEP